MSKKWIALIALYLGLLAACIVVLYAVPSVKGILEKTYIAEVGTLDVKDEVSAFIVRDEYVFVAKESSNIERVAGEGELVKASSAVANLTPRDGDSTAEDGSYDDIIKALGNSTKISERGFTSEAGYVSFRVDGAEADLTIENMGKITKKEYESLTGRKGKETPKNSCRKGEPVFKIIKNAKWYLVYYTDKDNAARYREDSYAAMDVNGEPIRLRVHKVEEIEGGARVMLECKSFFDGFLEERTLNTSVTLASAEGLIIQKSSIIEHEGRQGVFSVNKLGEHVFKPILIMADAGDRCAVYSDIYLDAEGHFVETIGTYDEIIAEPSEEDIASLDKKDEKEDKDKKTDNESGKTVEDKKEDGDQG